MKTIQTHLEKLRTIKRKEHHHLIHKLHKKYGISKKTLFYIKEYGPHSHISKTIIKESLKILLFASLLSSLGGLALEQIKPLFLSITPLLILLPALNDLVGNFGTIVSSRFSTMLHEGKIKKKWWTNLELRKLFLQISLISLLVILLSLVIAFFVAIFSGYPFQIVSLSKILLIVFLDLFLIISLTVLTAASAGLYFYQKREDPNNFLIPITTSLADFGNILLLAFLVTFFF